MGLTAIQLANVVDALRRLKADTPKGIHGLHTGFYPWVQLEPETMADLYPEALLTRYPGAKSITACVSMDDVDIMSALNDDQAVQLFPEQYAALQAKAVAP